MNQDDHVKIEFEWIAKEKWLEQQEKNNPIFHPNHYNWIPRIECLDVVEHFTFNLGCAMKYIWRSPYRLVLNDDPDVAIQDLKKGIFYLEREIDRLEELKEIADGPNRDGGLGKEKNGPGGYTIT